jgi:hypothetical protein
VMSLWPVSAQVPSMARRAAFHRQWPCKLQAQPGRRFLGRTRLREIIRPQSGDRPAVGVLAITLPWRRAAHHKGQTQPAAGPTAVASQAMRGRVSPGVPVVWFRDNAGSQYGSNHTEGGEAAMGPGGYPRNEPRRAWVRWLDRPVPAGVPASRHFAATAAWNAAAPRTMLREPFENETSIPAADHEIIESRHVGSPVV